MFDEAVGFGVPPKPDFWLSARATPACRRCTSRSARQRAPRSTRSTPRRIAAGGRDNGAPGLRPHYHPDYYGAFVLDPDGHNIEAVCHAPA